MNRLLAIMLSVSLAASMVPAADPPPAGEVTIAILKSMVRGVPPEQQNVMQENFQTVLKAQTGLEGRLLIVNTTESLCKQLAEGTVDVGAFSGVEFAWMKAKQKELEPLMIAMPNPDALRAAVVVAKDSPAKTVADLRGKKLAISDKTTEDSRLFAVRQLTKPNASVEMEFPGTYTPASVEAAFDDVVAGTAPGAVVDKAGLKMYERRQPGRFVKLRVLAESTPFPPAAIVYQAGKLDAGIIQKFRDGMATAHETAAGKHLMDQINLRSFQAVPADYATKVAEAAKIYPPS